MIDNLSDMIKMDLFDKDTLVVFLNDIKTNVLELRSTIDSLARNLIEDSIKGGEGEWDFDEDSWESNIDLGKLLLTSLGKDSLAIYNEIHLDVMGESEPA